MKSYYNIKKTIDKYPEAKYYLAYGERSNGKTYSALEYVINKFFKTGEEFAYVRRFGEDIKKKNMSELFSALSHSGAISKASKGMYKGMTYGGNTFSLVGGDGTEKLKCGYAFDLNSMEHYKSISFPRVTTIIFDEFISRQGYIPNEFVLFMNTISTIVRDRDNVKIIMLGNTVNKYCPHFLEMGITHIKDQKPGTIDVYRYGRSELLVVCEYCESSKTLGGKNSDIYFAFDNPHLQMITKGTWEIGVYPRLDKRYLPKDIVTQFFVVFSDEIVHCKIVSTSDGVFIHAHRKTTPIKDDTEDIVYSDFPSHKYNYRIGFGNSDRLSVAIRKLITENRIFYSSNDVGEIMRNYIKFSHKAKSIEGDLL